MQILFEKLEDYIDAETECIEKDPCDLEPCDQNATCAKTSDGFEEIYQKLTAFTN